MSGERVQVRDEYHEVLALLLQTHAAPHRAEVVADVQRASGLQS